VSFTLESVPEPDDIALLAFGLGFTAFRFRRHRS
jgi:hypothetical protein